MGRQSDAPFELGVLVGARVRPVPGMCWKGSGGWGQRAAGEVQVFPRRRPRTSPRAHAGGHGPAHCQHDHGMEPGPARRLQQPPGLISGEGSP